jgi:hypothetical protein
MARLPTTARAVARPSLAVAGYLLLLMSLVVISFLASALNARGEGWIVVPDQLVAATITYSIDAVSSKNGVGSLISAHHDHGQPSAPCRVGSCCSGTACHAPAEVAGVIQLSLPASAPHPLRPATTATRESPSADVFRPPIA